MVVPAPRKVLRAHDATHNRTSPLTIQPSLPHTQPYRDAQHKFLSASATRRVLPSHPLEVPCMPIKGAGAGDDKNASDKGSSNRKLQAVGQEKQNGGVKKDDDGSPSSQSSFFSGGTGEASLSSGSSSPVPPGSLSPSPKQPRHVNNNVKVKGGNNNKVKGGEEDAGSPSTQRSNSGGSTEGDRYADGGDGGSRRRQDNQPPPYHALVASPPQAPARSDPDAPTGRPRNQRHILTKKDRSRSRRRMKGNRGSSAAQSWRYPPPGGGLVRSSIGSGVSNRHMSPAEKAALRAAGEDSFATIEEQQGDHDENQEQEESAGGSGGVRAETEEKEASKQNVGVPDLEKAFIRSLAEIDADAKAYNNRVRPLLAHIPRPRLFGAVAPAPGVARNDGIGSCGSKKVVPMGHKKTLVLDLDETLVSSSRTPCDCDYKVVFKIHSREKASNNQENTPFFAANADAPDANSAAANSSEGIQHAGGYYGRDDDIVQEIVYYVQLRPGLARFLEKVAAIYELVVWTASGKSYADAIIDLLDPAGDIFAERFYRDSCLRHHNLCVKDLRRLGRPMNTVVLLDNYVYSFGLTLDNGVPISPWTGAKEAKNSGLTTAYSLLRGISRFPDVRVPLVTAFDLQRKIHGYRSPLPPTTLGAAVPASTARRKPGSQQQQHQQQQQQQRKRYQNPLSPVHSCSAFSSASSSPTSSPTARSTKISTPPPSPACCPTTGRRASGAGVGGTSRRGGSVGGGSPAPLSPVAAMWAANAETRAEEERLDSKRELLLPKKLRQEAQTEAERASQELQAKLATLVEGAKSRQQQQQRHDQRGVQAVAAVSPKATTTLKGGQDTSLSPVVAQWAAEAAARAEVEAKAAMAKAEAALADSSLME
ncbi:unnamed protein product [Ectocarpus sp. CCAP 1310/34]|nr:unnamed protein product [Ectocarpus sp. CCAP 1310/34]